MRRRALATAVLALSASLWFTGSATAHPLGNFTVNRSSGIVLTPGRVRIDYVVDMAEIPTFQLLPSIDTDGDGVASAVELDAWVSGAAPTYGDGLRISIEGAAIDLSVAASTAVTLPGQGGLDTLRVEAVFAGEAPANGSLTFRDTNFQGQIGWSEVTAVGAEGASVSADVPSASGSDQLRRYPEDLLKSPLDVTTAEITFQPGGSGAAPAPVAGAVIEAEATARPGVEAGPFGDLLTNQGIALMLVGLVIAVGFGAWHALLPGHGKTLMAAYMVGAGARTRQAVGVGTAVALMHTVSVLALGVLVLTLERTFRPEVLYPWLGLISGVAALALGCYLLLTRVRSMSGHESSSGHDHGATGHAHPHSHDLETSHLHGEPHAQGPRPLSRRGIAALALAGGILPAPSALLVMLAAINAHRVAYGLTLVVAFSAGLAVALIVIGMGALRARDAVSRRLSAATGRLIPVASASAIVLVGTYLTISGIAKV
ncbi:MAG: hypothetical protein ABI572_00870 [Actinomycetota bacterium]